MAVKIFSSCNRKCTWLHMDPRGSTCLGPRARPWILPRGLAITGIVKRSRIKGKKRFYMSQEIYLGPSLFKNLHTHVRAEAISYLSTRRGINFRWYFPSPAHRSRAQKVSNQMDTSETFYTRKATLRNSCDRINRCAGDA